MKNKSSERAVGVYILALLLLTALWMVSCAGGTGGSGSSTQMQTTGAVTTSISDPPTCLPPNGSFSHVWVTITKVQANLSSSAGPSDSGWVTLVDLSANPKQIDLLSLASTTCLLTQLGSTTGLTPGNYQQIRIILLSNSPASGQAAPAPNACGANGYNCVTLATGAALEVNLSSEAQTGIKIPPGQIAGGGIQLQAGQVADINIDFNACASIVQEGNGQVRLIPTLHAGEVSLNSNAISGTVVDSSTQKPVTGAIVLLEQPDSGGVDRVITSGVTDSNGAFIFCPLASGKYDAVVAASVTSSQNVTITYNATVTSAVPLGSTLSKIPLVPETGFSTPNSLPGTITGQASSSNSANSATAADIQLSALQQVSISGSNLLVTIPDFGGSTSNVSTASGSGCPVGTDCATYTLVVPGSNPEVGVWNSAGTSYSPPQPSSVNYQVNAQAFVPGSGGTADCTPSSLTSNSFTISLATSTSVPALAFAGCQ